MNNAISCVLGFVAGAAVGSLATYFVVKKKFDNVLSEERLAMKESFDSMMKKRNESKDEVKEETKETDKKDGPYTISPDEYGEDEKYEQILMYYYADGVLTDNKDNRIFDIEKLIGDEALNCFGEYEDDCVYVRNDELLQEYEIMLDKRNYKDLE